MSIKLSGVAAHCALVRDIRVSLDVVWSDGPTVACCCAPLLPQAEADAVHHAKAASVQ